MNQRTDLGGFLNGVDQPTPGFAQPPTFANGIFQGTTTTNTPIVYLLDTGNPNAAKLGKIGTNYPIDTATYKVVAYRMNLSTSTAFSQFWWARTTIYDAPGEQGSAGIPNFAGWNIYLVDLSTIGMVSGNQTWLSGPVRSLRFDPATAGPIGNSVQLDWARLVDINPALCRQIGWSGGAATVDIHLVDSATGADLGPMARNVAKGASSPGCAAAAGVYTFYAGALPPGTYKVAVTAVGGAISASNTSTATWAVNDTPTLTFTSPDPEGSSDDFATTFLNNPWDMNSLTDLDLITNITSPQITSLNLETPAGTPLGLQQVFKGTSAQATPGFVGDPYVDPLFGASTSRGFNNRIDTNRYRILTFEMGIPNKPRDILNGSIARIIWRVAGEQAENVSKDIIFNSRAGANVLDKIIVDLKDRAVLPLEPGSPSDWANGTTSQPGLDIFRVDPHEFSNPTDFYIKRIKLATFEKAATSFTIRWQYADAQAGTVDLYYNTTNTGACSSGFPMVSGSGLTASTGQFTWNVANPVADGTYYICASFTDGTNTNETYAKWPVIVQHNLTTGPRLVLDRANLNFGIVNRPNATFPLIATPAQTVRVSVVGSGTGCWTVGNAVPAQTTYVVTLSNGGSQVCGNGFFTIAVNPASTSFNVSGVGEATFAVREVTAGTTNNSPQYVHAVQRVLSSTTPPGGLVDTPATGATVSGSIAVTGWAIDDVGIVRVGVYRDPVAGETGPVVIGGRQVVPIGDAVRVDDARPDIEAGNPDTPFNYRAGWGYLLLTNFLPGGGDGSYTLRVFATDVEGKQTLLGSPVIVGANSVATRPFGAIDTPAQGEVVSGSSYNNFGWVLVRGTAKASPGFSTGAVVNVVIDGAAVGAPCCWGSRPDLDALFPATTFSGISKALGVFTFNPSLLANGVHTIAWGVTADNTFADGIGSRYFTVTGGTGLILTDPPQEARVISAPQMLNAGPDLGRRANAVGVLAASGPKAVLAAEMQRVVVDASRPGTRRYDAYLVANGQLRSLPIGASFDDSRGVLYWQPGVGYTGAYDFMVVRDGRERLPIRVLLQPQRPRPPVRRGFDIRFATELADASGQSSGLR